MRQTAVGLNFIDVYERTGLYGGSLPSGLGREAAGVVAAVGPGVRDVKAGDRVAYASTPPGAYADERVLPVAAWCRSRKGSAIGSPRPRCSRA